MEFLWLQAFILRLPYWTGWEHFTAVTPLNAVKFVFEMDSFL